MAFGGAREGSATRCALVLAGAALMIAAPAFAATLHGSPDADRLVGTTHSDTIAAQSGDDVLIGKEAADTLRGSRGDDTLKGGAGEDKLNGGSEDDLIKARDGEADLVQCGEGADTAIVDEAEDGVFDCEEIEEP